jgi:mono/diheme cytochrome c family protein
LPPDLKLALDSNPLARGAWLYAQNCYRCHQDYATGRMGIGLDRDRIERTIQGGKIGSNMPAFAVNQGGALRATDIKLIVNYMEAFEQLGVTPALPAVVLQTMVQPLDPAMLAPIGLPTAPMMYGKAAHGALLYRAYCAACHGAAGQGGVGPTLARTWTSVRPALTLRAVIAQGAPGTLMRSWAQTHGGPLDDAALDDVVAFLMTLPPGVTITQVDQQLSPELAPSLWRDWPGAALLLIAVGGVGGAIWRRRRS